MIDIGGGDDGYIGTRGGGGGIAPEPEPITIATDTPEHRPYGDRYLAPHQYRHPPGKPFFLRKGLN